jgi:hypothetical protein
MGLLTLFVSATFDNWTDNMQTISDNTGIVIVPATE